LQLTIDKLIYGGDGLARLPANEQGPGKAVFVPFVLEGESVDVALREQKRNFARGELEKVFTASPHRIEPSCPYFQNCGGCHYQHTDYDHQVEIKAAILKENLRRIAKLELEQPLTIHPSPPWNYRNRTRLKIQTQPEFAIGYYRLNSHALLPIDQCPISSPLINRVIGALNGGASLDWSHVHEIELFANADDSQLLVELDCAPDASQSTAQTLAEAVHKLVPQTAGAVAFAGSIRDREPQRLASSGATDLKYQTNQAAYRVTAGAFFQTNRHLIDDLVTAVTAERSGRTALDLFAGVGLFSSVLARQFEKVVAVEASPISHADLGYNSPANVKAVRAMSEQYLKNVSGKLPPDLVVVDPPRSGLGETVVHSLLTLGAPRIVYVSCDPATLSRDLGGLLRGGYRIEQAHLVDLFPQTYHLESVFHLVR
jgi:23S rRNA (uracil1939-C5)-methyltransferase